MLKIGVIAIVLPYLINKKSLVSYTKLNYELGRGDRT